MTNHVLSVRAADMRVIALCTLGSLAERCVDRPVERIDVWRHDDRGSATVGVTWQDESFTLIDFRHASEADAWLAGLPEPLRACAREHASW